MKRVGISILCIAAAFLVTAACWGEEYYSAAKSDGQNSHMGLLTHEMSDARIPVSESPVAKKQYGLTMDALYSVMGQTPGIKYTMSGEAIIVQGITSDPFFKLRLWRLNQSFENIVDLSVLNAQGEARFAALKDQWKSVMIKTLNSGFNPEKAHIMAQSIDVSVEGGHLVVNGEVNNPDDLITIKRLADMYDNFPIINAMVRNQMIELDVIFLAVSGNSGLNIGTRGLQNFTVNLPSYGIGGARSSQGYEFAPNGNNIIGGSNNDYRVNPNNRNWDIRGSNENNLLSVALQVTEADLSILARPHLSTLNGRKAKFHSGGNISIRIPSDNGNQYSSMDTVTYGTTLTCTPRLTSDGQIDVLVHLDFKIPTDARHISDSIDFIQHEYSGRAVLAKDQAIVLTGMMQQLRTFDVSRTPGVGRLPIIGRLFGGKSRGADNEELLVLIKPRIPSTVDFDCDDPFRSGEQAVERSRNALGDLVYEERDEMLTSPSIQDNGAAPVRKPFWRRK